MYDWSQFLSFAAEQKLLIALIILFSILAILFHIKNELEYKKQFEQSGIREIDAMSGNEFENYLHLLCKKYGYKVELTKGSNDYGADLILYGNSKIVVQAKRYGRKVGIKAVQEVSSAKTYYNADEAWVITNNFYSSQAIKLADSAEVRLIDRYELADLILNSKANSNERNSQRYL
jgi:restriction system protein